MQKEVDIKAVIGYSGTFSLIQVTCMMVSFFILTMSTLYIHLDQLW